MTEEQIQIVGKLARINNKISQSSERGAIITYIKEAYKAAVTIEAKRFQSKHSALDGLERIIERLKAEGGSEKLFHPKFQSNMTLKILMNSFGEIR